MLDPKKRDGYEAGDRRFLEIIDEHGWHVTNVFPRADSTAPREWFSYSAGLFRTFGHPEIILFGLNSDTAWPVINEIGRAIKKGKAFELKTNYADIFGGQVKCQFRPVYENKYAEYVGWAMWFYEGTEFPVWQCFWPDKSGRNPWEEGCDPQIVKLQPLLYKFPGKIM